MGNWSVVVTGIGPHHNGNPSDVEKITDMFLDLLRPSHTITGASVHTGSVIELPVKI